MKKFMGVNQIMKIFNLIILVIFLIPIFFLHNQLFAQPDKANSILVKIDYPFIQTPESLDWMYNGQFQWEIGFRRIFQNRLILGIYYHEARFKFDENTELSLDSKMKINSPAFEIGYYSNILKQNISLSIKLGYSNINYTYNYGSQNIISSTEYELKGYSLEPTINFNYDLYRDIKILLGSSYPKSQGRKQSV